MSNKPFRVRFTWGGGCWSFEYFSTAEDARARMRGDCTKLAYSLFGRPYRQDPQRVVMQTLLGSKWKTVTA